MIGLLNLGSLVLGVIAWILPVVNLMRYKSWQQELGFSFYYEHQRLCYFTMFPDSLWLPPSKD